MNEDKFVARVVKGRGETVSIEQAKAFVDRLGAGTEPQVAAREVGGSLKDLRRSPEVLARIKELQHYDFPDEVLSWLMKTTMTQQLLTADNPRDSQGAAKILAMKPELGFQSDNAKIEINILSDEIRNMEPSPLEWQKESEE